MNTPTDRRAYYKAYYASHKTQKHNYYLANREETRRKRIKRNPGYKIHSKTFIERDGDYFRKYYALNREKIISQKRKRWKEDIQFKLSVALRTRLWSAIKTKAKKGSAVRNLGCSIQEFKFYLEGKFKDGMTWENWSQKGWHIDHIIPLTFFDLTDRKQLLKAVHYTNLQPLWARENRKKKDRLDWKAS